MEQHIRVKVVILMVGRKKGGLKRLADQFVAQIPEDIGIGPAAFKLDFTVPEPENGYCG